MGKTRAGDKTDRSPGELEYFHWYDEPMGRRLKLDKGKVRNLLTRIESPGFASSSTSEEKSKAHESLKDGARSGLISVKRILLTCKVMDIDPNYLERMGLFRRDYPISLRRPEIYELMTHVINEGHSGKGRKPNASYWNVDPGLLERVSRLVESLGGIGHQAIGKDDIPVIEIDQTTGRALIKAGLVPGKKALGQYYCPLPDQMRRNPKISKYHLSATFTEEGWTSLSMEKNKRPRILINYTRNIDVTGIVPRDFIDSMEAGEKLTVGKIPDQIEAEIRLNPFPLLENEIEMMQEMLEVPPRVDIVCLYKSRNEKITVEWRVTFSGPEEVSKFNDEIGFVPGSQAEERFEKIWRIFNEVKDKKLSEKDIESIKKEIEET